MVPSILIRYYLGTACKVVTLMALNANTWYEAELRISADGVLSMVVWPRDMPQNRTERVLAQNASDWGGRSYYFTAYGYTGTTSLDEVQVRSVVESGQRTRLVDGTGSTTWAHDARGQLLEEVKTIGSSSYATEYEYNDVGLLTKMTYPDETPGNEEVVEITYLPQMLVDSVTATSPFAFTYVGSTQYDASGRITRRVLGQRLTSTYVYYPWTESGGRLHTLKTEYEPDPPEEDETYQDLEYFYDEAGNITQITDVVAGETLEYTYDLIDRLTSSEINAVTTSYAYDANYGNLVINGATTLGYTSPSTHQVTSAGTNTYSYDSNGIMTSRVIGGTAFTLSYNAENRLTGYSGGTTSAVFSYDGDGSRVSGVVNGVSTQYFGAHFEKEGSVTRKYYTAGATRVAVRDASGVSFLLSDHLGSTALALRVDSSYIVSSESEQRYSAWGETRYTNGTMPTKRGYTGQFGEPVLGILFYNACWMDPYHKLPKGTQLPDGLSVIADGVDVNPISPHPKTHYTIFPSSSMGYNDFSMAFTDLPWTYAGKK